MVFHPASVQQPRRVLIGAHALPQIKCFGLGACPFVLNLIHLSTINSQTLVSRYQT
jgi:hypothetical protein